MAASMTVFDNVGFLVSDVYDRCEAADGDEYVRCNNCGYGGCDIRVSSCGCTLHTVRRRYTKLNVFRIRSLYIFAVAEWCQSASGVVIVMLLSVLGSVDPQL